jgi:hypothetical protein
LSVLGRIVTGDEFLRYCCARHVDAEAFHRTFAPTSERAVYREAFRGRKKF